MTNNNNNVSTSTNNNTNVNQNANVNQNINSGEMTNTNINKTEITQRVIQPPPTAVAPAMMSGGNNDLCSTGSSGSVQTQVFGVSSGGTVRDMNCERLKLSKTLYDMGMKVAAVAVMCQDERVFNAMMNAGTPCPIDGKIGEQFAQGQISEQLVYKLLADKQIEVDKDFAFLESYRGTIVNLRKLAGELIRAEGSNLPTDAVVNSIIDKLLQRTGTVFIPQLVKLHRVDVRRVQNCGTCCRNGADNKCPHFIFAYFDLCKFCSNLVSTNCFEMKPKK
jgi:hypothetical protein